MTARAKRTNFARLLGKFGNPSPPSPSPGQGKTWKHKQTNKQIARKTKQKNNKKLVTFWQPPITRKKRMSIPTLVGCQSWWKLLLRASHAGPESDKWPHGNHWLLGKNVYSPSSLRMVTWGCWLSLGQNQSQRGCCTKQPLVTCRMAALPIVHREDTELSANAGQQLSK